MEDKKKQLKETLPEYTIEEKEYTTMPKKWKVDGKNRYIGEQDQSGKMWYEHIYQYDDLIDKEIVFCWLEGRNVWKLQLQ